VPQTLPPQRRALLLGACIVAALAVRLIHIGAPPLEFHPARQYRGALLARSMYWLSSASVLPWQRAVAEHSLAASEWKEPPLMEAAAAIAYRIGGGERLWIPRLLAAILWAGGAVLLHALLVALYGRRGSLLVPFLFLFMPFAVNVSRAFMPEAAMTAAFLAALLAIVRNAREPSGKRLATAAFATAAAALVKPVVALPLLGAFLALAGRARRPREVLADRHTAVFLAASIVPAGAYYLLVMAHSPVLRGVLRANFVPGLLLTPMFWLGWAKQIGRITGFVAFALAAAAFVRLPRGTARSLLAGALAGHLVYAFVFTYAIATHDYYHTAFFAIVSVALGAWGPPLARAVRGRVLARVAAAVAGAALVAAAVATADTPLLSGEARRCLAAPAAVVFGNQLTSWTPAPPAGLLDTDRRIGEVVGHSVRTILLAYEYGAPLCYYGGISGTYWPDARDVWARGLRGVPPLAAKDRLEREYFRLGAEYFIIEDMRRWAAQADLRELLRSRYAVVAEEPSFVVFDLRRPLSRRLTSSRATAVVRVSAGSAEE
jgi:hypothetical protein